MSFESCSLKIQRAPKQNKKKQLYINFCGLNLEVDVESSVRMPMMPSDNENSIIYPLLFYQFEIQLFNYNSFKLI